MSAIVTDVLNYARQRFLSVSAITVFFTALIALSLVKRDVWLFLVPVVALFMLGFYHYPRLTRRWRIVVVAVTLLAMLLAGGLTAAAIRRNLNEPPRWDFEPFWLNGRVSALGLPFYDGTSLLTAGQGVINFDDRTFVEEVVTPGFVYPPPAMFLFAPLGWFDIRTAIWLWYPVQLVAAAACVWMLWRLFLRQSGLTGLLVTAALTLCLFATFLTLEYAQLNFLTLLALLLFVQDRHRPRAGVWLTLAIVTKLVIAPLLLYLVLRRKWKMLRSAVITGVVLLLLTGVVYGPEELIGYLTRNPAAHTPGWLYTETFYQSLLAVTIRMTDFDPSQGVALLQPLFLIPAAVLTVVTIGLTLLWSDHEADLPLLALNLAFSLIIYPHTQIYYAIYLLLPVLWFWTLPLPAKIEGWVKIGLIAAFYLAVALSSGRYMLLGVLVCWLACAGVAVAQLRSHKAIVAHPTVHLIQKG